MKQVRLRPLSDNAAAELFCFFSTLAPFMSKRVRSHRAVAANRAVFIRFVCVLALVLPARLAQTQEARAQEDITAAPALHRLPTHPVMPVPAPPLLTAEQMAPLEAPKGSPPNAPRQAPPWDGSLAGTLSASQAAYSNWSEGGLNSAALAAGLNGKATKEGASWQQTYEMRLALGLLKQDTLDVRKAEDLIRLASALQYEGNGFFSIFNPTLSATARTQFAPGFNYKKVPDELQNEGDTRAPPVRVSSFLAPGTFTESFGLTYEPAAWLVQRFGLASKQTVVHVEKVRPLYSLRPSQFVRFQAGLSASTQLDRELMENIRLQSSLDLFTAFNQTTEAPDVAWENIVAMKVNRYFSVNFEFVALYDSNISSELQLKESLSLGVTVAMI